MNIGNTNLETRLQCHDPINNNFIYGIYYIPLAMRMYKLIIPLVATWIKKFSSVTFNKNLVESLPYANFSACE